MALTIRQLAAPDGKKMIHFQEGAGKMEIVVSRETIEWALERFDLERDRRKNDEKETVGLGKEKP